MKSLEKTQIDTSWSLFLDRDGVINERIIDGYVSKIEEFKLLNGVKEAMNLFHKKFGRIIVVTNQQGIGKGIMTEDELKKVHEHMLQLFDYKIDKIYHSPHLASENNSYRKPGIGMALNAKTDFPAIDFQKSVIVGDSPSDMLFGKNAGMKTVFVGKSNTCEFDVDLCVDSLAAFAALLGRGGINI